MLPIQDVPHMLAALAACGVAMAAAIYVLWPMTDEGSDKP